MKKEIVKFSFVVLYSFKDKHNNFNKLRLAKL